MPIIQNGPHSVTVGMGLGDIFVAPDTSDPGDGLILLQESAPGEIGDVRDTGRKPERWEPEAPQVILRFLNPESIAPLMDALTALRTAFKDLEKDP